ncbi:hypothetical protein D3C76_487170 [compost metagenome]
MLVQDQAPPTLDQLAHLAIVDRRQALLQHPGKPWLIPPDGKAEAKHLRQLRDAQLAQLVVAQRILQLIELGQHGIGLTALHRRQPLQQAVGHPPVLLPEPGQQAGVVQHAGHDHPALDRGKGLISPPLAADQGIATGCHRTGELELLVQCRRLQQTGHHGGLPAAQPGERLLLAGNGDQLEIQPRLAAHFPQHIAAPADELTLLVDAAVGHEVGIRHQLDGARAADQPGLLLVGEVQGVDVLLALGQIAPQIPVEAARRQEADRRVYQLLQLRLVVHHQPVADHQIVAAQPPQAQPLVRELPHQIAQLQIVAEVGAASARHQSPIPVLRIRQAQLGGVGIEPLQGLLCLPDGRDQEGRLLELPPIEDGGLRLQHGPAQGRAGQGLPGWAHMGDEIALPALQALQGRRPVWQFFEAQRHRQLQGQSFHLIDEQPPLLLQIGRALQDRVTESQLGERIGIRLGLG